MRYYDDYNLFCKDGVPQQDVEMTLNEGGAEKMMFNVRIVSLASEEGAV